jgi:hypothetical protein
MKHLGILFISVGICILFCGCPDKEDGHMSIKFFNKSSADIACQISFVGNNNTYLLDTLFVCNSVLIYNLPSDSLFSLESFDYQSWERNFKGEYGINYIQCIVMDAATYDKYKDLPCDTIRKYVPILHRYRLKLADLERMNWMVVYPPEE